LVAVSHTLCAYVGTKKSGDAGILSLGIWGVADPWKYACPLRVLSCRIRSKTDKVTIEH